MAEGGKIVGGAKVAQAPEAGEVLQSDWELLPKPSEGVLH